MQSLQLGGSLFLSDFLNSELNNFIFRSPDLMYGVNINRIYCQIALRIRIQKQNFLTNLTKGMCQMIS